jgi:hypothetical protein
MMMQQYISVHRVVQPEPQARHEHMVMLKLPGLFQ